MNSFTYVVYCFIDDNYINTFNENKVLDLPSFFVNRLNNKKCKDDIVLSYFAYKILLNYLSKFCNITDLTFALNNNGKIYCKNSDIKFNISHSKNLVAICFSNKNVGIDVEKIRNVNINLLNKFHTEEKNSVIFEKDVDIQILGIWTKKEAYLKAEGLGITKPLNSFNVLDLKDNKYVIDTFNVCNDYVVSISHCSNKYNLNQINIKDLE